MSQTIVSPSTESDKSMPEFVARYRIVHTSEDWYWTGSLWGMITDARIYTERERNTETLPERGLWQLVPTKPIADVLEKMARWPLDRSIVAQAIAQLLLSQHCREEGVRLVRLHEVSASASKRFLDAGEFITNFVLSPDRAQTALLALADTFCIEGDPERLSILDASPRTQRHFYELAVAGLFVLQDNVKEVPSDWHYRDQLARLLDVIVPPTPEPHAQVHAAFRGIVNAFGGSKGGL